LIRIFLPEHDISKNIPEDVGSKTMGIRQVGQMRIVMFGEFGDCTYLFDPDGK